MPTVTVLIVTWRRHEMLRRAIRSALDQTHRDLSILVVNDDPEDSHVAEIVSDFHDTRLDLFQPVQKRGAARNFNLMFDDRIQTPFVALLEDDNWWQPEFLATMLSLLERHPEQKAACANERIWRENPDGSWTDTGQDIWPNFGETNYDFSLSEICGSAKLCNSAMVYRKPAYAPPLTPDDIPVDVTEHFRERMFPDGMALHSSPLVNYAETLKTARGRGETWGKYQSLLIGSVFAALPDERSRRELALTLWTQCPSPTAPRAVTLVMCGLAVEEARLLLTTAPKIALLRAALNILRRPITVWRGLRSRDGLKAHFAFLRDAPLTRRLAGANDQQLHVGRP